MYFIAWVGNILCPNILDDTSSHIFDRKLINKLLMGLTKYSFWERKKKSFL